MAALRFPCIALLSCPEYVREHREAIHLLAEPMAAKLEDAADNFQSGRRRSAR